MFNGTFIDECGSEFSGMYSPENVNQLWVDIREIDLQIVLQTKQLFKVKYRRKKFLEI